MIPAVQMFCLLIDHTSGRWIKDFTSYLDGQTLVDSARVISFRMKESHLLRLPSDEGKAKKTPEDPGCRPREESYVPRETGFPNFLGP